MHTFTRYLALSCIALLAACASTATAPGASSPAEVIAHQSPREIALSKIKQGAVVFDARTDEEFQSGHYPNAINVPVDLLEPTLPALESYKDQEIVVYCRSGKRAERLKQGLLKAGFSKVYNAGGLSDLQ
jgi:rhodanese-related sulfurtransferase